MMKEPQNNKTKQQNKKQNKTEKPDTKNLKSQSQAHECNLKLRNY